MLRESTRAWSNGSEAYSSDPDEEEEEEDMIFGEPDQDGVVDEMMDLSDLPTALFACNVHEAVFEEDADRVGSWGGELLGSHFIALWLDVCLLNRRAECVITSKNESPAMSNKCMMSSAALAPDMHI